MIHENDRGEGCIKCAVKNCDTMQYRGSRCSSLRAQVGISEDPLTHGEQFRMKSNREIAVSQYKMFRAGMEVAYQEMGVATPHVDSGDLINAFEYALYCPEETYNVDETSQMKNALQLGVWINYNDRPDAVQCSNCKLILDNIAHVFRYCPNCGKRMKERE